MSISWNVCLRVDIVNMCICYMSTTFWLYVFIYAYTVECMYICLSVFVFMYLYACKFDGKEREVLGGQFDCLEEGCYLSPRSNNFVLQTDFDLQRDFDLQQCFCPLKIDKQIFTTGDNNNFLMF